MTSLIQISLYLAQQGLYNLLLILEINCGVIKKATCFHLYKKKKTKNSDLTEAVYFSQFLVEIAL